DELLKLIQHNAKRDAIFCVFATKQSFSHDFVNYEPDASQHSYLRPELRKILVLKIDDVGTLPHWLANASTATLTSPSQIEREIRYQLNQTIRELTSDIFVGRRKEIELSERLLAPTDTLVEPHSFCFFGISGIGRKTLCIKVAKDL